MRHAITLVTTAMLLGFWSAPGLADQKLAFATCALVKAPFLGHELYRGTSGGGCSWGLTAPDGVTLQNEVLNAHTTRAIPKEQLAAGVEARLQAYRAVVAQGMGELVPLALCDGGWFIRSDERPTKPIRNGFYTCGHDLVEVEAQGPESIKQFLPVARGMLRLVR